VRKPQLSLTKPEIIFEEFQPMWSRYLNVTDRQADRQLAVAIPRSAGHREVRVRRPHIMAAISSSRRLSRSTKTPGDVIDSQYYCGFVLYVIAVNNVSTLLIVRLRWGGGRQVRLLSHTKRIKQR